MEIKSGVYRHYKGDYYLVLGLARHSETEEEMVVYVGLIQKPGPRLNVRPAYGEAGFFTNVEVKDRHFFPRFEYVGNEIPNEM